VPKLISEVTSGQSNELTVQQGQASGTRVRAWRVILNAPGEQYSVEGAIGVRVGDLYPGDITMTCSSISERASGDSRVAREITATYKTIDGQGQQPEPPDIRPATFSISSTLIEVPANKWREVDKVIQAPFGIGNPQIVLGQEEDTTNPVGDRYEGVAKTVPIITITIEQFDNYPTSNLDRSGYINSDSISFLGWSINKYHCMLRSINIRPVVEKFGDLTYRGFTRTFEFAVKMQGGWVHEQILEGWNCKNDGLGIGGANAVDEGALSLKHDLFVVVKPLELATPAGQKVRASVKIAAQNKGGADSWCQRPSGLPVALNEDGTPRNVNVAAPKVLTKKYITNEPFEFGRNFQNLGVRIRDII
jgi:hypothetical protein